MKTVGVIGTGKIAAPMVRSLLTRFDNLEVFVSPRSVKTAEKLAQYSERVTVAESNQDVLNATDTVLLSMMADVAREVLPLLTFRPDHEVISVMVDYSIEHLLADCSPVTHIELTMPLPFIENGGCPLPCYPSGELVNKLFGADNPVTVLATEAQMLPYIAIAGSVSGFLQGVASIGQWLGHQSGSASAAEAHVLSLLSGSLQAIRKDGKQRLEAAMDELSTEGGLNEQYRQALLDAGVDDVQKQQLDKLLQRLSRL